MNLMIPQTNARTWQGGHRYTPYPIPSNTRQAYVPTQSAYTNTVPYSSLQNSVEYSAYTPTTQTLSWSRGHYTPSYAAAYEDEQSSHFVPQPPAYMLPSTDPMASMHGGYLQSQFGRNHANGIWSEQLNSLPSSAPQLISTGYPIHTADTNAPFNSVNPSLPLLPIDRTLPTPFVSRGLPGGPVSSLDSLPMTSMNHRSSNALQTDVISNSSGVSSRTSCSTGQESTYRTNSSSASATTTDIGLGYLGISNSAADQLSAQSQLLPSALCRHPIGHHSCRPSSDVCVLPMQGDCRTPSQEDLTLCSNTSSQTTGTYSYTTGSILRSRPGLRHGSMSTIGGHLSNGVQYQRLPDQGIDLDGADGENYQGDDRRDEQGHQKSPAASLSNTSSY